MQHFIHFAIFLVLATAHLTSAAVNIMFKSCLSWIAAVRQKTKSTVFVSKPPIPELHGGSNQAVTRMALKTTCKQDCFLSASSGWSMREGCQIGLRIYAVESVMSWDKKLENAQLLHFFFYSVMFLKPMLNLPHIFG